MSTSERPVADPIASEERSQRRVSLSLSFARWTRTRRGDANPVERLEPLTQVNSPEHRHFDCERYDECLTVVANAGWESFSCVRCPKFRGEP